MTTQRDNTAVLFRNDRKTDDRQPDYRGEALVNGQPFKIAGWLKEGKSGKFLSVAFTPKEDL